MPGTSIVEDIELIIEDIGGGGGKNPPPGGDDGDEGGKRRGPQVPSSRRYATAIVIAIISIVMFFMAMASAYIYLRARSDRWVPLHLPAIIWINTVVLLLSSGAMELSRRRLSLGDVRQFRKLWFAATALGFFFLAGQLVAWRQFVLAGFYVSTNQSSSFSIFLRDCMGYIFLAESALCSTCPSANLKKQRCRAPSPLKSPLTTGTSWTAFGFFFWLCFILGK